MNKRERLTLALLGWEAVTLGIFAQTKIEVQEYRYAGPFKVQAPVMVDSIDLHARKFGKDKLLDTPISLDALNAGQVMRSKALPGGENQLHLIGFMVQNTSYTTASITVEGLGKHSLYVDGVKQMSPEVVLEPSSHSVVVKYLSEKDHQDSLHITVEAKKDHAVEVLTSDNERLYSLDNVLHGWKCSNVSISPNGKYAIVNYNNLQQGGQSVSRSKVWNLSTKQVVDSRSGMHWMPRSNCYYYIRGDRRELVSVNPQTREETVLCESVPSGAFTVSPTEDYLIISKEQEGPKEKKEIFEVVEPDDRQPGWRNRNQLVKFDLKSGLAQPVTYGYHNVYLFDISEDGKYLLVMKSESRLTERPTTVYSLYRIHADSFEVDTLVTKDGFMDGAQFSPDGKQVLLQGSPEAFGGIGNVVPEGRVPSMVDKQLYLMDIRTRQVKPMTKEFNPCVSSVKWCKADGNIYFNAEDKDCINLFRMNPKTGNIQRLNVPEELVTNFDIASSASMLMLKGQGASNSDRIYTLNTKTLKTALFEDLSKDILQGITLGECQAWNYLNDRGDTICCRYYLPPHFDATKHYPMIVNYYGGCSPTSRNFESRYPHHAYAAQGYVVLVVNPSGATGFGQEFSSRHVNTAGEGVAQDIIGATKTFCKEHAWVDATKIGCIGASYGGFMTQYLQTVTDIFAAAISHAGISDHTSYWGEGYWGYSYSEVSMANSYPWTDKHLYVAQSPLFNADKIHTPLLFLHGTADTNVPVGESIQMFTALKLLGRETAMVLVDGQNHHILDYQKRKQWQNTIFAWFAKWLKGDDTWWKALYDKMPDKK